MQEDIGTKNMGIVNLELNYYLRVTIRLSQSLDGQLLFHAKRIPVSGKKKADTPGFSI